MIRSLNPFVYSNPIPPSQFIGRTEVVDNCYNRLAGPVRSSIAISGEHGLGKTSLLHYLRYLGPVEQWGQPYTRNIFLYLDCQDVKPFTPTLFWQRILEKLRDEEEDTGLHEQIELLLAESEIAANDFRRVLRFLGKKQISLILLLDSFTTIVNTDNIPRTEIGDFLSRLRALINQPDYSPTLITATRQHLDVACKKIVDEQPGSRFYNNFTFESLLPFTPTEINALYKETFERAGVALDPDIRSLLHHIAGAHPALLQMAGFHIFTATQQGELDGPAYKKIIEAFEKSARHYFSQFWQESSATEQILLILTILHQLVKQSALPINISLAEIETLLRRYERDLLHLIERGLLNNLEGSYHVFSAVFAWWLIHEVVSEKDPATLDKYKTLKPDHLQQIWQTFQELAPYLTLDRVSQTLVSRAEESTIPLPVPSQTQTFQDHTPRSSSTTAEDLPLLPRFQIEAEIGRGASGVVYKALDPRLDRQVAIKLLHRQVGTTMLKNEHLLREAQTASKLVHANIVRIYDVDEFEGQIFLVMEYVQGRVLTKVIQEKNALTLSEALILIEQAAEALDYAHSQSVIHRDFKPDNLLITDEGQLKLTDFGVAKVVGDPHTTEGTGSLKGTLMYMSPEQVDQKSLDYRSDIFSLATVAFELLCGLSPWQGKGYYQVSTSICESKPRSLTELDIAYASELEPIFAQALDKDPSKRFHHAKDFVEKLKSISTDQLN